MTENFEPKSMLFLVQAWSDFHVQVAEPYDWVDWISGFLLDL
jgi:hypothetical protein